MPFLQINELEEIKNKVLGGDPVFLVGTVSYEERCLAFFDVIKKLFPREIINNNTYAFKIIDDESDYRDQAEDLTDKNLKSLKNKHGIDIEIVDCGLMYERNGVKELFNKLNSQINDYHNLFIDISSLPRRYLLEILKNFLNTDYIKNLIIFYSTPIKYQSPLVIGDLIPQELLSGSSLGGKERIAIAALGLNKTQLSICIEHINPQSIILIIPYPSTIIHEVLYKNRDFIEEKRERKTSEVIRLRYAHPYNPLQLLEILNKETEFMKKYKGEENVSFSLIPLSTKVQALAMFIYGINNKVNIVYAQPRTYNVPYSYGYSRFFVYRVSKDSTGGHQKWLKIDSGIWTGKLSK